MRAAVLLSAIGWYSRRAFFGTVDTTKRIASLPMMKTLDAGRFSAI